MRFLLIALIILIAPIYVHAQSSYPTDVLPTVELDQKNVLKGPEYSLEFKPLEPDAPTPPEEQPSTLPEADARAFEKYGYVIKPYYFEGSDTKNRETYEGGLTLSIEKARLDFGSIASSIDIKQSTNIITNAGGTYGYQLIATQMTPFQSAAKTSLPPLSCDDTSTRCQESNGWGYALDDDMAYHAMALRTPTIIDEQSNSTGLHSTKLSFHLSTPANTPEGTYSTTIQIVAIPEL